jgi:PAS domain S-box-containing protein
MCLIRVNPWLNSVFRGLPAHRPPPSSPSARIKMHDWAPMPDQRDPIHLSFFADAFRDSPAPTIVLSADGLVRFWNRAAERVFGWSAEETIGKPIPFIPPEKAAEHGAMRARDLEGDGFTGRHISRRRKDGALIELSVSTAPIRDDHGRVTGILSVYADITAEKRQEEALRVRQRAADRQISELAELTEELHRRQDELRLVIDGVPGLVAYVDRARCYRFVNRDYAAWFDLRSSDLEGRSLDQVPGREWFDDAFRQFVDPHLAGAFTFERSVDRLGDRRELRATCVADRADDGALRGVVALIQDITEQKRAVKALSDSEERFRRIVEIAAEGIWIVDLEGRTTFVNPRMADLLGYSTAEMMDRPFLDFLHPDDKRRAVEGFQKRKSGDTAPREYRCRRKDGADVWIDYTATPMRDGAGSLTGVLAMCTDVTERKHADRQLRQTQKLESLGILAGGIAHDFNNLLVGIMGNATLAIETLPRPSSAEPMLHDVIAASERAARLTRQLLAYAGKEERSATPTDISVFVRDLGSLLRTSVSKLVHIAFELDEAAPPVMVDQAQLQQIVMNLVINAAEAIPGNTPGVVTIATETRPLRSDDYRLAVVPIDHAAPRYVALSIRDTGSGMDIATQARIFDPFFTTKFDGRGLGLSAVLGIVRGHRGTITLQTAPGEGTCFTVLLPVSEAPAAPAPEPRRMRVARGAGTVLVVDDESVVRDVARRALEHNGYDVLTAVDGRAAIEQVRERPEIRAVVLDLAMPEMGGDTAAVEIRSLRPQLPIVLCSGYAERDAAQRCASPNYSAFLQKPYTARALIEMVGAVLD